MANEDPLSAAEIIDLERAQIGHDLHDILLPLIFAASANLQPLIESDGADGLELSPENRKRVQQAGEWLHEALSVGRNLLTQIYPPELSQLTWLAAAKDTAGRIAGDGCEVTWFVDEGSPVCDSNWDRGIAAAAYRVLVEAVRNAVRHGKAEAICVRCDEHQIAIVDDGVGFDPEAVDPNRFGIKSMKGRARLVGKKVNVESVLGGPTKVTFEL